MNRLKSVNVWRRTMNWSWLLAFGLIFLAVSCSKSTVKPDLPTPITPDPDPNPGTSVTITAVDEDVLAFMARFNVPGASIAISRNGKIVYAKGYGNADRTNGIPVDTGSLFRIASLSKFITAIGIMKLVEDGKLKFSDRVFGEGSILGLDYVQPPLPAYVGDITVQNLLHHEIGGWGNSSSDPAFQRYDLNADELIAWTIENRPLTVTPGTELNYSNLGYMILGKIIEKKSSQTFEQFIKQEVFDKTGAKSFQIAGTALSERKPNEVLYYGMTGQNPYGYGAGALARILPAGGWIAKPIDYLRIMNQADGFETVPDILKEETITLMSTSSPNSVYGAGIRINKSAGNWWHGGGLTGTRTWMVRATKGFSWTIFLNHRNNVSDSGFDTALDRLIWPAVNNSATPWPDVDLF